MGKNEKSKITSFEAELEVLKGKLARKEKHLRRKLGRKTVESKESPMSLFAIALEIRDLQASQQALTSLQVLHDCVLARKTRKC